MGENRKEKNRRVCEEGFEDPLVAAGKQPDEEAWKERYSYSKGSSSCEIITSVVINCRGKGKPLADKCEATGKEDEDKSWREKSSQLFLLLGEDQLTSRAIDVKGN